MTRDQLQGRHARLARELTESAGVAPLPAERIERLTRDLAETERLLRTLDAASPAQADSLPADAVFDAECRIAPTLGSAAPAAS